MAGCFAAAACATAYRRRWGYALFYIVAAVETYAKLRYPALTAGRDWLLGSLPPNDRKYPVQIAMLAAAAIGGGAMLSGLLLRLRRAPAELALALGTFGVVAVFVLETVSYHFTDAIIYTVQGGMMRSGWMYAVPALVAAAGAMVLPRR